MISKNDLLMILNKPEDSSDLNRFKSILNGDLAEDDFSLENEKYLLAIKDGLSLTFKNDGLSSIHLYCSDDGTGYSSYQGWIGDGLKSRELPSGALTQICGSPNSSGGGEGFMGKIDPNWVRYDFDYYYLHYTFDLDNKCISLITLGLLEK